MNQNNDNNVNRRQFFVITWLAALLALAAQVGVGLLKFMTPILEEGAFGTEVKVGRINEFEVGSVSYFRESRFYLVRLEEGFLAMYRKCPHLGCVIPWEENEGVFNCPCHSSLFTMVGEVIDGPAPRPMDTFPVVIRAGEVYVDTGVLIKRDAFDPAQVTPI